MISPPYKCMLLLALPGMAAASNIGPTTSSPFRIVIDGGSTGSRLHIFEFVSNSTTLNDMDDMEIECIRRGSARANIPLSAYGRISPSDVIDPDHVAAHLLPLFEYAAEVIPSMYHDTTRATYQGTAGMRLLDLQEQHDVYDALYEGLISSDKFVFESLEREDIATLSGDLEGFYGAVAANYLKGTIDAKLRTKGKATTSESSAEQRQQEQQQDDHHHHHHHGPLGALDMGGSSTQIVYLPKKDPSMTEEAEGPPTCTWEDNADSSSDMTCSNANATGIPSRLVGDDFFATSYLSYGVDQFRERLWNTWVNDRRKEDETYGEDSCSSKIIDNPCTFKGYVIEWEGYTLIGTGDAHECVMQVRRLIPHHEEVHDDCTTEDAPCDEGKVGGVEHPPLRGRFFAMSLYFFTLDSLRELSHPSRDAYEALNLSWPTPSIEELYNALDGLCSRSWQGDLEEIQHDAHAYTRAEVLPHRCLESVYMVTLLRDGFGFHPTSRDITFTFLVDGSEVEWSLGMALAQFAEEHDTLISHSATQTNVTYEEDKPPVCVSQTCPALF